MDFTEITAKEAGLTKEMLYNLIFKEMNNKGGMLSNSEITNIVNEELQKKGCKLSYSGKCTLRRFINFTAVNAGYVEKVGVKKEGWQLTLKGQKYIE